MVGVGEAAAGRAVAWVSAESESCRRYRHLAIAAPLATAFIGLAVFERSALRAVAIGSCWSQGRLLAWRADS
ncbi:MAG: hypothetical protein ACYDAL_02225 [Candidatus Dormibacteraceae bacterium]